MLESTNGMQSKGADSLSRERLLALLSSYFGGFVLLLMCIGLFGLLSYSIARRVPDLGLRIALGADSGSIRRLVLRESSVTVLLGTIAGILGSCGVTRLLRTQLFDVDPLDPVVFADATLILITLALVRHFRSIHTYSGNPSQPKPRRRSSFPY